MKNWTELTTKEKLDFAEKLKIGTTHAKLWYDWLLSIINKHFDHFLDMSEGYEIYDGCLSDYEYEIHYRIDKSGLSYSNTTWVDQPCQFGTVYVNGTLTLYDRNNQEIYFEFETEEKI